MLGYHDICHMCIPRVAMDGTMPQSRGRLGQDATENCYTAPSAISALCHIACPRAFPAERHVFVTCFLLRFSWLWVPNILPDIGHPATRCVRQLVIALHIFSTMLCGFFGVFTSMCYQMYGTAMTAFQPGIVGFEMIWFASADDLYRTAVMCPAHT